MTLAEFSKLGTGDIIQHVGDKQPVVVTSFYGDRATAVRTFDVTNPREWEVVLKASHEEKPSPEITNALEVERIPTGEHSRKRNRPANSEL